MYPGQVSDAVNAAIPSIASSGTPSPLSIDQPTSSTSLPSSRRISHSWRKAKGHTPRPPNAFMLFRSDFWAKEKQKEFPIERDHRDISRIAGHCWNNLDGEEKARYQKRAEQAKDLHTLQHPGYKYAPTIRRERTAKRKTKKGNQEEEERCKKLASLVMDGVSHAELREAMKDLKKSDHQPPTSGPSLPARCNSPTPDNASVTKLVLSVKLENIESPPLFLPLSSDFHSGEAAAGLEDVPLLDLPIGAKIEEEVYNHCRIFATVLPSQTFFQGLSDHFDITVRPPGYGFVDNQFSSNSDCAAETFLWYNYDDLRINDGEDLPFPSFSGNVDSSVEFTNPFTDPARETFSGHLDNYISPCMGDNTSSIGPYDSDFSQYFHFD